MAYIFFKSTQWNNNINYIGMLRVKKVIHRSHLAQSLAELTLLVSIAFIVTVVLILSLEFPFLHEDYKDCFINTAFEVKSWPVYNFLMEWKVTAFYNLLLSSNVFGHSVQFSSVAQSCPTLQPHESQHTRPLCPSPTPGVHSNSRPLSRWCHPAISSSVIPFSSCPQSLPALFQSKYLLKNAYTYVYKYAYIFVCVYVLGWSKICSVFSLRWL